ncbi:hypothetical protein C8_11 [Cannes 8 virus]|uniref:Uncharacterized protein n=1 Tax=Marseillevirus marseillevirus TaxID=694581 RepID=D2XA27_GBMV|nr:hypothetical protein MAR_ORF011 [Marseillevirus marseillevirus]YP_009094512.1 hypothetical protein MEL_011 [Melbournevirus]ADB03804.1 hypothetical protein MAR_ORF011 [Marseillevirus marseillevirus]AGV01360.1 hypothetical protein C8_11 [Cannes 8 virus]AIT54624.1 hypothetical protein MEL_011 [Melbournevirus]
MEKEILKTLEEKLFVDTFSLSVSVDGEGFCNLRDEKAGVHIHDWKPTTPFDEKSFILGLYARKKEEILGQKFEQIREEYLKTKQEIESLKTERDSLL